MTLIGNGLRRHAVGLERSNRIDRDIYCEFFPVVLELNDDVPP